MVVGNQAPLTSYSVQPGQTYRFHTVSSNLEHHVRVEIDNHQLTVVALDGVDIQPITCDAFFILPGERVDFTITANQNAGSYWLRSIPIIASVNLPQTRAIIRYTNAPSQQGDPVSSQRNCSTKPGGCVYFNCIFGAYSTSSRISCISLDTATDPNGADKNYRSTYGLDSTPYKEIFLNFALSRGDFINGIVNSEPRAPILGHSDLKNAPYIIPCSSTPGCSTTGCTCTNIIELKYNKVYQFVLTNYSPRPAIGPIVVPHPIHVHGHNFAVLKIGYQPINSTSGLAFGANSDVTCVSPACLTTRWAGPRPSLNTQAPPVKDTVLVPAMGYVVVRFKANNPGLWFLHCHMENHMVHGMSLFFNEAPQMQPRLPRNFPTCGDFNTSISING